MIMMAIQDYHGSHYDGYDDHAGSHTHKDYDDR